jgi:hypothetical protein
MRAVTAIALVCSASGAAFAQTTNPPYSFNLGNGTTTLNVGTEGTQGGQVATGGAPNAAVLSVATANSLQFGTTGVVRMTVTPTGNIGIGTATPGQLLSVAGVIESVNGGFRFPDGTVQTTAASGGTAWSPSGTTLRYLGGGVSAAGTIESTTGGFKFPDGTIQTTAAAGGTNPWTKSGADVVFSGGNVGIGTTPGKALDVIGDVRVRAGGGQVLLGFPASAGTIRLFDATGTETADLSSGGPTYFVGGNVGIGTVQPRDRLHLLNATGFSSIIESTNSGANANLEFRTISGSVAQTWRIGPNQITGDSDFEFRNNTAGTTPLFVKRSTGNVGIGTTTPQELLSLQGTRATVRIDGNSGSLNGPSVQLRASSAAGGHDYFVGSGLSSDNAGTAKFYIYDQQGGASRLVIDASGNVGVGTIAPAQRLSVAGTIESTVGGIKFPDGTLQTTAVAGTNPWTLSGADVSFSGGNVGIGTAPGKALDVIGDVRARSGGGQVLLGFPASAGTVRLFDATGTETADLSSAGPTYFIGGNVGIGTANPGANLHVASSGGEENYFERATNDAAPARLYFRKARGMLSSLTPVSSGDVLSEMLGQGYSGAGGYVTGAQLSLESEGTVSSGVVPGRIRLLTGNAAGALTERVRIDSAGNVGIGTLTPGQRLSVAGVIESTAGGFRFPDGTVQTTATSGGTSWTVSGATLRYVGGGVSAAGAIESTTGGFKFPDGTVQTTAAATTSNPWTVNGANTGYAGGSVGVGTTSPTLPSNGIGIDVRGSVADASGYVGLLIENTSPSSTARLMLSSNNTSLWSLRANTDNKFMLRDSALGVDRMTIDTSGNLGIGTTSPSALLHVRKSQDAITGIVVDNDGTSGSSGGGQAVQFAFGSLGAIGGIYHYTNGVQWSMGLRAWSGGGGSVERLTIRGENGNVGIGTSNPTAKLHVAGSIVADGTVTARYQDVAEWVDAEPALDAGTIVVIDKSAHNRVVAASLAYDVRVAGAVSAQPGVVLGEPGDGRALVAQSGRVRIKVDASYGAIEAGDLLVTSPTAGYAMRSEPVDIGGVTFHRPGTVLGKALEPLASGRGEILVLLTLQ